LRSFLNKLQGDNKNRREKRENYQPQHNHELTGAMMTILRHHRYRRPLVRKDAAVSIVVCGERKETGRLMPDEEMVSVCVYADESTHVI